MKERYKLLFLLVVALGIYYPTLFGGVNSVDDWRLLVKLLNVEEFNWYGIFLPHGDFNYRPLLMLSFWADKVFWELDPSFMHLENMLLHAGNVLLVFALARNFSASSPAENQHIPLLAALIFAVHPINTESVNWISGRTDLLATFFLLLSALVLVHATARHSHLLVLAGGGIIGLAIMSKEVAVFFLPLAAVLLWHGTRKGRRYALALTLTGQYTLVIAAFLGLRLWRHGSSASGLSGLWTYSGPEAVAQLLTNLGFYVKKLFVPWPLNFAIVAVDPHYFWLGGLSLILAALLVLQRDPAWHLMGGGLLLLAPALILSLTEVAWTPVAERYLYQPLAFFCIGFSLMLAKIPQDISWKKTQVMVGSFFLVGMAWTTSQRNLLWQDNLSLYQDTLNKSPQFASLRNELAIALINRGEFTAAEQELVRGDELRTENEPALFVVNRAVAMLNRGEGEAARRLLKENCPDMATCNPETLRMWARVDEALLQQGGQEGLKVELIEIYGVSYRRSGDPFFRYRQGQLLLFVGEKERAAGAFEDAYKFSAPGTYYREAAGKLARRLRVASS